MSVRFRQGPLTRRAMLGAAACGLSQLLVSRPAQASLFRAISLPVLAQASEHILLGTPIDASSHWETLGGRRRIVTHTRLRVDDLVAQTVPSNGELVIRTLGGTVGELSALVYGEAALIPAQPCLLFLAADAGMYHVTGMAQGHYPLLSDANQTVHLMVSPRMPALLAGEGEPAMHLLAGQELGRARALIQAATVR